MPARAKSSRISATVTAVAIAAVTGTPLIAQLVAPAAKVDGAQVGATAAVMQPLTITYPVNMTTGTLVGTGKSPSSITIPASYQGSGNPGPTYINLSAGTGKTARPATAAQVLIRGTPNQAFTLRLTGWVQVSADSTVRAPSATRTGAIYYLGGSRSNLVSIASGQLDSKGVATVGIGSTITLTLAKSAIGQVTFRPQVDVSYN